MTCALRTGLGAWCWGSDDYGAQGTGTANIAYRTPAVVRGLEP